MKTYSTFLPVFTGFYCNGNFVINLENEIDHIHDERKSRGYSAITDIDLEVDTAKFESDVAKELCEYVESEFNQESDTKISIKFGFAPAAWRTPPLANSMPPKTTPS